ncbi:hypothetical protein [Streptomyces sp. B93]|uniref:hypothetical protein n=1 Tax=Streptomyces sp. B93 TaxID=2824875 RepID=UPI001B35A80F|nr:hypothetical protein [Streptomyces sp. B93]MBQ1088297.1 hypothetical protein [Streptomyces sp. B93]
MRTASTHQPSTERDQHRQPADRGTPPEPLRGLRDVPWQDIRDSTGPATAVPLLLNRIAWGNPQTAAAAVGELRDRICQYGFVVEQATAATVPFLWELVQLPQVTCRPQLLRLLAGIAGACQWERTASAYPKLLNHPENPVAWERAARRAVRERAGLLRRLPLDDTELGRATAELSRQLER